MTKRFFPDNREVLQEVDSHLADNRFQGLQFSGSVTWWVIGKTRRWNGVERPLTFTTLKKRSILQGLEGTESVYDLNSLLDKHESYQALGEKNLPKQTC
jgi:hypothetical protein